MEVIVGKLAGFCGGVQRVVEGANKLTDENEKIYCLGEIVHNKEVINSLESKGMVTVDSLDEVEDGAKVIFRAHGVTKEVYEKAKVKNLEVYDLTCVNVINVHKQIEKESEDSFIILIGDKNHPEVVGSISFAKNGSYVVESEEDVLDAYMEYEKNMIGSVKIFAQTTFDLKKFEDLVFEINDNFAEAEVNVFNTICMATSSRQAEMIKMSKDLNNMIIIGGKNSANTKKLVNISKENCENVYHVQTVEDLKALNIDYSKIDKIGIMAGASTPKDSIENIRIHLENM